jgi:hypothetical protein
LWLGKHGIQQRACEEEREYGAQGCAYDTQPDTEQATDDGTEREQRQDQHRDE